MTYTELIERLRNDIALMPVSAIARESADAIDALQADYGAKCNELELVHESHDALQAENERLKQDWNRFHHLMKKHGLHPGRTDDDLLLILDAELAASKVGLHNLREKNVQARAERDALQSRLDAMGKGEAVAWLVTGPYEKRAFDFEKFAAAYCAGLNEGAGEAVYKISELVLKPIPQQEKCTDERMCSACFSGQSTCEAAHGIHAKGGQ